MALASTIMRINTNIKKKKQRMIVGVKTCPHTTVHSGHPVWAQLAVVYIRPLVGNKAIFTIIYKGLIIKQKR